MEAQLAVNCCVKAIHGSVIGKTCQAETLSRETRKRWRDGERERETSRKSDEEMKKRCEEKQI